MERKSHWLDSVQNRTQPCPNTSTYALSNWQLWMEYFFELRWKRAVRCWQKTTRPSTGLGTAFSLKLILGLQSASRHPIQLLHGRSEDLHVAAAPRGMLPLVKVFSVG